MRLPTCSVISLAFVASSVLATDTRNCTEADLNGEFNTFRLTDTLTTYAPGTDQILSYDHPADSPVNSINSVIIVTDTDCSKSVAPAIQSELPVTFNDEDLDIGGAIHLQLPATLAAGGYRYVLDLTTDNGECLFHSDRFESTGETPQGCVLGTSTCLNATALATCVADANATTTTYTGPVQECGPGTTCTQSGSDAFCTSQSSSPTTCLPGSMRCTNETAWQQCIGAGDGWFYGADQACAQGTACKPYLSDYIICDFPSVN